MTLNCLQLSKAELLVLVSRDRAVIDLLRMSQGDMSAMEFVAAVEDQSHLCQANTQPITEEDLVRMALIGGMRDRTLAEKVLAENYNLKTTITVMKTRETSKANAVAMRGLAAASEVNRLKTRDLQEANLEEEHETNARLEEELAVMKLRRQGRYSSRGGAGGGRCRNCNLPHDRDEECSAKGRRCYACDGSDHYARAPGAPTVTEDPRSGQDWSRSRQESGPADVKRNTSKQPQGASSETDETGDEAVVHRVMNDERAWPGTKPGAKERHL